VLPLLKQTLSIQHCVPLFGRCSLSLQDAQRLKHRPQCQVCILDSAWWFLVAEPEQVTKHFRAQFPLLIVSGCLCSCLRRDGNWNSTWKGWRDLDQQNWLCSRVENDKEVCKPLQSSLVNSTSDISYTGPQ
jgi:hypothetical protein